MVRPADRIHIERQNSDDSSIGHGTEGETPPSSPMSQDSQDVSELPPHEAVPPNRFANMPRGDMLKYIKKNPMTADDLKQMREAADAREVRSPSKSLFGKTDYEKLRTEINNKQTSAMLDDAKSLFGSGVQIPKDMQDTFVRAMSVASPETIEQLRRAIASRDPHALAAPKQELISAMADNNLEGDIKPVQQLIDSIGEQMSPETFNTQYRNEYLPRQWMSSEEQMNDNDLMREHAAMAHFAHYMGGLSHDDPRRMKLQSVMDKLEQQGFQRTQDYNITQINDLAPARLYGIKRTEKGFQSVLGLVQGDRSAVGTDDMNWPHETTDEQNAGIMKILRQVEKANPQDQEQAFESAYQDHGAVLDSAQKEELKQALLQFSAARSARIADQLTGIGVGTG